MSYYDSKAWQRMNFSCPDLPWICFSLVHQLCCCVIWRESCAPQLGEIFAEGVSCNYKEFNLWQRTPSIIWLLWVFPFFLTFPACFLIPIIFSNLNSNCSNLFNLRNLQEQVKKALLYQKLFWPLTVWTNCCSDLKFFAFSLEFQKFFSITRTIYSNSERSEQLLVTEFFFNLFLDISQI